MIRTSRLLALVACAPFLGASCGGETGKATSGGEAKEIVVWWAKWAPADGLQKLGERYEKETGVRVSVQQTPWSDYQRKVFQEFGANHTAFDVVVGDSQWIGSAVADGFYLDLTDWLEQHIDVSKIHQRAAKYLCEYPQGSGRFYAAPCETDSMGCAYRTDWFEDPKEKEAFRARYGYDLAVPKTWKELREIAEFFQRPAEQRYGIAYVTGRDYDGMTMGFQQLMWAFGGAWADEKGNPRGVLDSEASAKALEFLIELIRLGPKGAANSDYGQTVTNYTNGSCAMVMNYFAFFPDVLKSPIVGTKTGFFVMPTQDGKRGVSLGGQGMSISTKTSAEKQALAKDFIEWFLKPEIQRAWIGMDGCFTADAAILKSEEFARATPFNRPFVESMDDMRDFWNIPEFGDLLSIAQRYLTEAVDGKLTPKEALEHMATEQEQVLREAGVIQG